jgi:hypothetical protein
MTDMSAAEMSPANVSSANVSSAEMPTAEVTSTKMPATEMHPPANVHSAAESLGQRIDRPEHTAQQNRDGRRNKTS